MQQQIAKNADTTARKGSRGRVEFDTIDPKAVATVTTQNAKAEAARKAQAEIAAAQRQLDQANARTPAQRIALLQRQQQQTTDPAERIRLEAQLVSERNSLARESTNIAKSHASELTKQLDLTEKIRDSEQSRYRAALSAQELAIKDRQDRRKEDREIAAAQRIIGSSTQSAEFRAAAAYRLALIDVNRQQRALQIYEPLS